MILSKTVVVSNGNQIQNLARQTAREIFLAENLNEAFDIIQNVKPELIIFDQNSKIADPAEFLKKTDKISLNIPTVIIGNDKNDKNIENDLKNLGAYDYLESKNDYEKIKSISEKIKHKTLKGKTTSETKFFANELASAANIVGQSKSICDTLAMMETLAKSRCNPILIVGETGTGKELVAKAIHQIKHPDKKFVALNCAALTANLLESELFGHVKGAFTGADKEKTGLLEIAGSGSIFLDEISEMPLNLQAKLLRFVQEKNFRKVGGTKTTTCKAIIIASSNKNLKKEANNNRFRKDLFYRLNIFPIHIQPLRAEKRKKDIKILAEYFFKNSTIAPEKKDKINSITKLALESLEKHHWPGNVRELRNTIERAILLESTDKIGLSSIKIDSDQDENDYPAQTTNFNDFSLQKAEKQLIARALKETGWQKTKAAILLGITRATLYAKVKQYNIKDSSNQNYKPKANSPQPVAVN